QSSVFTRMPQLQILNASNNSLTADFITNDLMRSPNLHIVDLRKNEITSTLVTYVASILESCASRETR
ncbi:hypothetical protein, partial [Salmonella sp. s54395]|uniref:hypothetical protein n=1 Tax=Salmonella sp. s54395 TaxID=3159664 RepID=UPI00397F389B